MEPHSKSLPFINDRRWWWLALLFWSGAVGLSWQSHIQDIQQQSIQVATEGARNMFRMVVLSRSWNASHGGVYVPITPLTQPNPYLIHPQRDVLTTDGMALTLVNPAFMTRLIGEIANIESGAIFRLTSLKPLRPENAPDPWEAKSLLEFESGVPEAITMEPSQDGTLLRYMAPLVVLKSCLPCHAVQGYKLGDVRGGISVSQRYSTIQASSSSSTRQSSLIHASIFVLIALLGWVLLELLRKRWFELAGKVRELEDTRGVLLQSEKMASLGRMVAGFAHEINTPVGVAVGAVSQHEETLARIEHMLTQDEVNEDALRAELNSLRQGGALALSNLQRAAKLVHSFKRTSIDQSSDEVRVFAIHELIQDVLYTLQNVLKRLPIKINVMCDTKLRLHSMPGLIEQLLTNLIMNAVQHAFEGGKIGGTIEINVSQKDDSVVLIFKDDGAGMSAQQLARAFEPFFTTRRGEGGSGLGLYLCYNIVTSQLHGTLVCESTPQAGCCFTIRFPAQFDFAAQRPSP